MRARVSCSWERRSSCDHRWALAGPPPSQAVLLMGVLQAGYLETGSPASPECLGKTWGRTEPRGQSPLANSNLARVPNPFQVVLVCWENIFSVPCHEMDGEAPNRGDERASAIRFSATGWGLLGSRVFHKSLQHASGHLSLHTSTDPSIHQSICPLPDHVYRMLTLHQAPRWMPGIKWQIRHPQKNSRMVDLGDQASGSSGFP